MVLGKIVYFFVFGCVLFAKNILILNSYHSTFVWTKTQNDTIVHTLRKNYHKNLVFYVEYMDTKRFKPTKERLDSIKNSLKAKYSKISFDIVVATDDNAINFIINNKKELFKDAKIFFSGVNNLSLAKN